MIGTSGRHDSLWGKRELGLRQGKSYRGGRGSRIEVQNAHLSRLCLRNEKARQGYDSRCWA